MENEIFDKAGKALPYVMPEGFDTAKLMQDAILRERNSRKPVRLSLWIGSSVAAVAAAVLLLFVFKPSLVDSDPVSDYHSALTQYCNSASDAEMEKRCDMQDADYMVNMDHYEAYYN